MASCGLMHSCLKHLVRGPIFIGELLHPVVSNLFCAEGENGENLDVSESKDIPETTAQLFGVNLTNVLVNELLCCISHYAPVRSVHISQYTVESCLKNVCVCVSSIVHLYCIKCCVCVCWRLSQML